jgi:hypothetical protein
MDNIHITKTGQVKLMLNGRSLTIGQMMDEGRTFFCKRSDDTVFRLSKSLGFNHLLMSRGTFSKVIVFMTPSGRTLETTRETILQYGSFLHFKSIGYERQLFLKLSDMKKSPKVVTPIIPTQTQLSIFEGQA